MKNNEKSPALAPTTTGASENLGEGVSVKNDTVQPIALHLPHRASGHLGTWGDCEMPEENRRTVFVNAGDYLDLCDEAQVEIIVGVDENRTAAFLRHLAGAPRAQVPARAVRQVQCDWLCGIVLHRDALSKVLACPGSRWRDRWGFFVVLHSCSSVLC